MDSWYDTKELMLLIESFGKIYYCPLKANRQVDESGGALAYRRADELRWSQLDLNHGKLIKIRGFPEQHKVKLFRVELATNSTDWIATNDLNQDSTRGTQKMRVP